MPDLITAVGDPAANAYSDLDFASDYADSRLGSDVWINEEDEDKLSAALIQSTRILDSVYDWHGWQHTTTQALGWPRNEVVNQDQAFGSEETFVWGAGLEAFWPNDEIPLPVKRATCELAISLLTSGGYDASVNDLNSVKVGSIRIEFNSKSASYSIPPTVIEMLRKLGSYKGQQGGNAIAVASLVRV